MGETEMILVGGWLAFSLVVVPAIGLRVSRRTEEPAAVRRARALSAEAYVSILPSRLIVQTCRILGAKRACLLVSGDDGRFIVAAAHGMGEEVIGERTADAPAMDLRDGIAIPVTTSGGRVVVLCAEGAGPAQAGHRRTRRLLTELTTLFAAAVGDADPRARLESAARACGVGLAAADRSDSLVRRGPIELVSIAHRVGARLGLDRGALIELQLAACVYEISTVATPPAARIDPETGRGIWVSGPDPEEMAGRAARFPGFEAVALIAELLGERWDGAGHPHELRSERIPLASRVLAVCGAVWMLTIRPPHGAGAPVESALRYVQATSGTAFDPTVVLAVSEELMGETPRVGGAGPAARARTADWARADALYSI